MEVGRPDRNRRLVGDRLMYTAGLADKIYGTALPVTHPEYLALTLREPYGVCGSIVPWNAPANLMINDVGAALAAGNTIVVKPAEDAPLACLYIASLAAEAGIPPGVVNVVTGLGAEAGAALSHHPGLRHLTFTGSPETGARVMAACSENLVPVHLELGGKSPQIILPDANLEKALGSVVRNLITNAGQICTAGTRLIVHKSIHGMVVDRVARAFGAVRLGRWFEDVEMGPLINAVQEQRVLDYIQSGKDEGARLVVGGGKVQGPAFERGAFIHPTLFDGVDPSMRIAREEIFGPVLSVIEFSDVDQAIEIANATKYGLVACVWTRDLAASIRLVKGIRAGQVYVNGYGDGGAIGAPSGGYNHSGFGRARGFDSLLEYTQTKSIILHAEA
jgi:acyl-CoA reductase-like NAD-dependent aldehyde dehydrogenase